MESSKLTGNPLLPVVPYTCRLVRHDLRSFISDFESTAEPFIGDRSRFLTEPKYATRPNSGAESVVNANFSQLIDNFHRALQIPHPDEVQNALLLEREIPLTARLRYKHNMAKASVAPLNVQWLQRDARNLAIDFLSLENKVVSREGLSILSLLDKPFIDPSVNREVIDSPLQALYSYASLRNKWYESTNFHNRIESGRMIVRNR